MPDEQQLSAVLSEFARTMVTDFPIQKILDHLVLRIVDIMPITAAGVTLISPGAHPRYVAASNSDALAFEKLQTELGEGPCVAAFESGEAVSVHDLNEEDRFPTFVSRALQAGLAAVFTFPLHHGDHQLGALDLYRNTPGLLSPDAISAARTLAEVVTAYIVNAQSRADLQEASDLSRVAALHDGLTGLANRSLMLERLEHALLRSRRSGSISGVFFLDLDRFKDINDTLGHKAGDQLLVAVGERLSAVLRPGDTLARVSGDEFVMLCEDLDTPANAEKIVERLGRALGETFVLSGIEVDITASVGVAFTGQSEDSPEDILDIADTAMYRAKHAGGARHCLVDPSDHLSDEQWCLGRELLGVLVRQELYLEYQPIVTTSNGYLSGVEALLRWAHPRRGLVSPNVLVPLAEKYRLITAIGRWTLEQASSEQNNWRSVYEIDDLAISLNVSARQLMSPGFTDTIGSVLQAAHNSSQMLTLEVTETALLRDRERALLVLTDLKDMGVRLALDNFGAGNSPLDYLLHFPLDVVKIDRALIAHLSRDTTSLAVVSAIIQLSQAVGMTVVAAGVETAEQHRLLQRIRCDFCQGFYFARPMAAHQLDSLIARQAPWLPRLPT